MTGRIRNEINDYCDYQRRLLQEEEEEKRTVEYSDQFVKIYFSAIDFDDVDKTTPTIISNGIDYEELVD